MKQKFLLKTMLLLCALVAGTSMSWAETFSTTYVYADQGTTWSQSNFEDASNYWKSSSTQNSIATIPGIFTGKTITSNVVITLNVATFGSGDNPTSSKFSVYTSSALTTQVQAAQSGTLPSSSTYVNTIYTVTQANASNFSDDLAIKVAAGTKQIRLKSIQVEFSYIASGSSAVATTTTIDDSDITNTDVYTSTDAGSLSATVTPEGGSALSTPTITWSGNNDAVATIDENTGAVTLVGEGTVTFTASYAGETDVYVASSDTYEMTVTDSTPFAGGNVTFDATSDMGTSPLSKKVVTFACSNGVLNNGTEYRLYKSSVTTFSLSSDAVDDGYVITSISFTGVSGNPASGFGSQSGWTTDGNNGTWTGSATSVSFTASGAQVRATQIVVTVAKSAATISVDPSSIDADAAGESDEVTVTYSNITSVVADVQLCDADGNDATYDWFTASINGDDNVDYIIEENTSSDPRTAYFRVYALDDESNYVYSAIVTVTQAAPVAPPANEYVRINSLDQLKDGCYVVIAARYNSTATAYYAMTATASGKPTGVAFTSQTLNGYEILPTTIADDEDSYLWIVNTTADGYTFTNTSSKVLGYTSGTNFAIGGDNTEWAITKETSESTSMVSGYTGFVITNVNNSGRGIALNSSHNYGPYATSTNMNTADYNFFLDIFVLSKPVSVTDAGYTTYVTPDDVAFTNDVTAYRVSAVGSTNVTLEPITEAPADEPVVIKASEGTYYLPVLASASSVGTNLLSVSDGYVTGNGSTIYALGKKNGAVGFYLVGSGVTIPADKAYLVGPAYSGGAKEFLTFSFEDDADGLERVQDVQEVQGAIFNLAGQRLSKMQKGINIVNGKKILY